ncbi:type II/IV secretion system ATPase subunit [Halohasta salina]|uniref:type II/IV secretion system ATPase subunit n=1 Tax=Halohasta salina TaxID=2961621 RepID=UPI0020A45E2D|nr:type II/IV secretion system ATPase subunit [Halohasta salina]
MAVDEADVPGQAESGTGSAEPSPTDEPRRAVEHAAERAGRLHAYVESLRDPSTTPVVKGVWSWEHYKRAYYYEPDGSPPRVDGEVVPFDEGEALGFDPDSLGSMLAGGAETAERLADLVDERTVDVHDDLDEDAFFTTDEGSTTLVNRYDLEKAVPIEKKTHFTEVERYWVNEPYAFVIIFRSTKENETKYYVVEPYRNEIETDIATFLTGKLRTAIKYGEQGAEAADTEARRAVIEAETDRLLARYGLYDAGSDRSAIERLADLPPVVVDRLNGLLDRTEAVVERFEEPISQLEGLFDDLETDEETTPSRAAGTHYGEHLASRDRSGGTDDRPPLHERLVPDRLDPEAYRVDLDPDSEVGELLASVGLAPAEETDDATGELDGIAARPEPAVLAEDPESLTEYQVEKLLYYLQRDFLGYERIDPIKHDINVEDISCDGYNSPVFVYHSGYEQIITNVIHGEGDLDDFVVKLAQRSGKGVSKRSPQVDATLPDGSRAQLTLGKEVSDHGTNYTIRQFKEVPFTPVDLINWKTFSLDQMAFLWLAIENDKSLIFAGGTASGKTTSLNAVSLFIPSNTKIVSIEDTREVELPQRNWIASVTRPSFTESDKGDIDEFDLLEAALRQRPDYIVMGEIRGEEGRTLFQVMSTGHTTYTTFHADSVGEVLKRFTTQPINVSKTMFSALDLVSIQTSTRVRGKKVRRTKSLTEINHYDAENDEINVQDIYQWQAEGDEFLKMGTSNTLEEIKFDRGWTDAELKSELFERRLVLAYLIDRGLNTYTQVAATVQAYINDPDTILALMANDQLEASLEDLREMESVLIDVDPETEALVPRPDPGEEQQAIATEILEAGEELFEEYRGRAGASISEALDGMLDVPEAGSDATGPDPDAAGPDLDEAAGVNGAESEGSKTDRHATDTPTATEDSEVDEPAEAADNPFDAYLDAEGEPVEESSLVDPTEPSADDEASAEGWGIDGVDPDEEG